MTRPEAVVFCREMYGRWTGEQIRTYLAEQGFPVCNATIRDWADEEVAARNRERRANHKREQRVIARAEQLRGLGMSYSGIAIVLSVDFGVTADAEAVRTVFRRGRLSRAMARELAA